MSIVLTMNHDLAADKKKLRQLLLRGASHFRFNASYFTPEDIKWSANNVFEVANDMEKEIQIYVDLPGAKRRIGTLSSSVVTVKKFQKYAFQLGISHTNQRRIIPIPDKDFLYDIMVGDILTLKEGKLRFLIVEIDYENQLVITESLSNGMIVSHLGYGFLKKQIPIKEFPEHNLEIIRQLDSSFVHYICLSYIESPDLIREIRRILSSENKTIGIVSKIETPDAINRFSEIALESDIIWFCRGDLLNFIRPEDLYYYEKTILSYIHDLPVSLYVAGENLYGYVFSEMPTRAELSHLGYLYETGIEGIVLSDETADTDNPIDIFLLAQKIERKYKKHVSS